MLIDDAAGRAEQRGGAANFGLELVRFGAGDQAHAFDVVDVRALEQVQQHLLFFIAVGDDELAAVVVFDASRLAVGVQGAVAGDTEARLEAARRVVEAGMNHAAVARRGHGARMGFRFEQQHFAARQRQRARHGEAHDTRADNHAFDPVCHILNLSCKHRISAASSRALLLAGWLTCSGLADNPSALKDPPLVPARLHAVTLATDEPTLARAAAEEGYAADHVRL